MKITPPPADEKSFTTREFESPDQKLNLREQYELERDRLVHEFGGLEDMRMTIGLNRRRLCRLLLVDPSAWTRWCRDGAPPHIYRALAWLIELRNLRPSVVQPNDLSSRIDVVQASTQEKLKDIERQMEQLERKLTLTQVVYSRAQQFPQRPKPSRRKRKAKSIRKPHRKKQKLSAKKRRQVTRSKRKNRIKGKTRRKRH